jgi:hypothetical protein
MIIRCVYYLGFTRINPDFFKDSLAVGTVPDSTGIVMNLSMTTICAGAYVVAHLFGFAVNDGITNAFLLR